jgi:hypothetical protein
MHFVSAALSPLLCRAFLVVGWIVAAALPARAALKWEEKTINLKADARTFVAEARYRFTNAGESAVDIEQVQSSCGCTTAQLERRHYAPGESGEIVAQFTVGERVGPQTKTIAVKSSDSGEWTTLTLNVDIPEVLRMQPASLDWTPGEKARPKTMTLEFLQEAPLRDLTVQTSNAGMHPELREIVRNRRYELVVTPAQTHDFLFATLTIRCQFGPKEEEAKQFRAFATVKQPPPPGADAEPGR